MFSAVMFGQVRFTLAGSSLSAPAASRCVTSVALFDCRNPRIDLINPARGIKIALEVYLVAFLQTNADASFPLCVPVCSCRINHC
ncbi:MAG: hypothetical protein A3H44_11635 [Gammaproteobacteria bacterium RIFCSPLOWO2_02_FULL_57_10]|nr:MAG: hypothetical protein A3H44_11635 [Gammaproteobacteria bacterium RIFCSPLOWO2_02_FULL_57_10]